MFFFRRRENRSFKMEMIKQSFLAAKVKEELRELKRNQQHRANIQTQASVHDSAEVMEATPMSSSISFGGDVETSQSEMQEKNCNWCHTPFNCFQTRKKRLKHIRNCKKSKGRCRGGEIASLCFIDFLDNLELWFFYVVRAKPKTRRHISRDLIELCLFCDFHLYVLHMKAKRVFRSELS